MKILQRRLVRVAAVAVIGWCAVLVAPTGASAAFVINRATGLASPDVLIDFGSGMFADGTIITNQFTGSGVTFGSNYIYGDFGEGRPEQTAGHLLCPCRGDFGAFFESPGSITFSTDVSAAVFSFVTNADRFVVIALLDGALLFGGEFEARRDFGDFDEGSVSLQSGHYFGHEGIVFDELRFLLRGTLNPLGFVFQLDNLQYNVAVTPVPLPAALPLFLSALAGLGLMGWRRRQAGA